MKRVDLQGNEIDPAPASPLDDYDRSFGGGVGCRVCGVMVPAFEESAAKHTEWHAQLGK